MTPYSGTEHYIFISYAHKDSARVLPLIEGLAQAGMRVWYDEGIEVGSEWPAFIEARVRACHRMIFFATEAAVESRNCRREVNLADFLQKEILVAFLERTELKDGMALQLGSSQWVFRDKYADDAAFLRALAEASILAECRGAATASKPAPKPTPQPTHAPKNAVYAKRGRPGLTDVIIPDGVTEIEDAAFMDCEDLKTVIISNSVTSIGDEAFANCSGLTSVAIPDSVTRIGDYAFANCSDLTSVTIPDSVTSIGNGAFDGCSGLTSVTIPNSVTRIGYSAFYWCWGLTSVTIPDSVTSIGKSAFNGCSRLTSVTIPDSVTSIGNWAFKDCSGLTSVTIPAGVTRIGLFAFRYCSKLTTIRFTGTKAQWQAIEKDPFWDEGTPDYTVYCTDGTISK